MKNGHVYLGIAGIGLLATGCMSPQGQPDYTASGALAGGATGAIIGSAAGRGPGGALVGAAVGAVAGGVVGHSADQAQQMRQQAQTAQPPAVQGPPLAIEDIKALAKSGVGDDVIISQIRNSRTVYHLGAAEIIALKNAGVGEKVIDYMINTPSTVSEATVAPSASTGVVEQQVIVAPGPDYMWIDGGWFWYGGRWMWYGGHWGHRGGWGEGWHGDRGWHGGGDHWRR